MHTNNLFKRVANIFNHFFSILIVSLLFLSLAEAKILDVPETTQEQNQWCWAGVSSATLAYYGQSISQCTIAEYTRTHATFHNFGSINCCQNASQGCNYWNYGYGYLGSIQKILQNWGVNNYGYGYALSQSAATSEIDSNRPFIMRWGWTSGGGHFLVGHGIENGMLHYMDPWFGEGLKTSSYSWVVSASDHTWTHTNVLTTTPSGTSSIIPQSGWWWNAAEPGRGYFIEVKNGRFYIDSFLYDKTGIPIWYVTGPGDVSGSRLSGTLDIYAGGQTLTGSYKAPTGPAPQGAMTIVFSDSTHGTITWPGGSIPIIRYEIASGSLSAATPSFKPETGWWWNSAEGGRGFSFEVQGEFLYIAGFMYDDSGSPVWYVSGGKMATSNYYEGYWQRCANGQAMSEVFHPATCSVLSSAPVAIYFSSTTSATMRLPDGKQLNLSRFSF